MSETSYTDPKVIEASKNFVNVVAHQETAHGDREILVGREKLKLCTDYFTIPCSTHVKGWAALGKFFEGNFVTPTTVFADPSGAELLRKPGTLSGGELVKAMQEALGKVSGEKIPLAIWNAKAQLEADVDAALAKGDGKKAQDLATKLGKLGKAAAFKEASKEAQDRIEAAGRKALEAALGLEKPEEKKKALQKIADAYKPLPVADEAKKALDGLK
jgi:hypothetical protein